MPSCREYLGLYIQRYLRDWNQLTQHLMINIIFCVVALTFIP